MPGLTGSPLTGLALKLPLCLPLLHAVTQNELKRSKFSATGRPVDDVDMTPESDLPLSPRAELLLKEVNSSRACAGTVDQRD